MRCGCFFSGVPCNWRELMADVTWFFRWSPRDVGDLTIPELLWWAEQARRIQQERGGS